MKKKLFFLFLLTLFSVFQSQSQIYTEDFTGENGKGAVGPAPTIDLSGVTWTIDVSGASLSATTDWFRVENEVFEARDIDGNAIWFSPSIDISAYTNVFFNLDASEQGTMEVGDILNTEYRINGGSWTSAANNGALNDDFTSATVSQTGITGNTLEIRVIMNNGAGSEYHRIDNILVDGTSSCTPPATPSGSITGTTPACNSTTLTYNGTDTTPGLVINYWQSAANGTDQSNDAVNTFNATTSGTYYVRKYDVVAGCWSTSSVSYDVLIDSTTPTISTQPTDENIVLPNSATFSVTAASNSTETYQWQVNTGSGWTNVSGATVNSYTIATTLASMDGDQYRCIITNTCGATTSNAATLNLSNNSPNNVTGILACYEDTSVDLSWNAPATGSTPDGYVVFILEGATDPAGVSGNASNFNGFNTDFSLAPIASAGLGRYVFKGNATNTIITGLTEDDNYSITVYAYVGETLTGWAAGGTNGSTSTNGLAQGDIRNLASTPDNNQVTLNWNNPTPTSCWDQLIIVANEGAVAFTPTGDGSAYSGNDNDVYSGNNQLVYETTSNVTTKGIFGLTNGTQYCFRVFIRRGTTWTEGVEICETPEISYCDSFGDDSDGFLTGIRRVQFNTIDNATPIQDNDYSDFTAQSTDVFLGEGYDLTVNVNTDGPYDVLTRAWIDWNNDGDFNDSGEQYELGDAFDSPDVATTNSPLNIEVPVTANVGSTRMRIAAKYDSESTSCETGFDGEVEDYTINVVQSANAEINVKGNNITIPDGFSAPYGLNNTLFAATNLTVTTAPKAFSIQNVGLSNLSLTGTPIVEITGAHASDFSVSLQPSSTNLTSYAIENFEITFTPSADGVRTALVSIANSDSDENPYTFVIEGTGVCSTTPTSTLLPNEGPEGTEITVNSPGNNLTGATATLNGVSLSVISSSNTELIIQLPVGAGLTSGNLVVTLATGCSSTNVFTIIDNVISSCQTGASATLPDDLFISEVTDATTGSSTFIEIFNGTGNTVNLSDYEVNIYNNGGSNASSTIALTGTLANNNVLVLDIGTTSCPLNNLSVTVPPQYTFSGIGGINFDVNGADAIQLEKISGGTVDNPLGVKDSFGLQGSDSWANSLAIGTDGANFRRKNDATPLPNGAAFDINQWDIIDWTNCGDSDYADIGVYDFSIGIPPSIVTQPNASLSNCQTSVSLSVLANEGVSGGLGLVYTWFYLAPGSSSWVEITSNGGPYSGFNQATLIVNLTDSIDVNGYQYYCQVRENSATCYQATQAVKLDYQRAVWNGSVWSGTPDINTISIIDGNYDTSAGGDQISFEACNLVVNSGNTLNIRNSTFVKVANNVINEGTITVQTQGAFVQDGIGGAAGSFTNQNGGESFVNKTTATFNSTLNPSDINYTYWSLPVLDSRTIETIFPNANGNRRFFFQAENFKDTYIETSNNNCTSCTGQDDIDDNGNDWDFANGASLEIGRGYAVSSTPNNIPPFNPLYSNTAQFIGALNTGDYLVTVYKNEAETADNNWNFIGNPYPSAISIQEFLSRNAIIDTTPNDPDSPPSGTLDGAVFMWSQESPPNANNNGNEQINFNQDDYIIFNGVMGTSNNGTTYDPYIPSGQGFFVSVANEIAANSGGNNVDGEAYSSYQVVFDNAMRSTGNNGQFFSADENITDRSNTNELIISDKLWLNLTSDNGIFSQIGLAYANNASIEADGWYYDTPRNLSAGTHAMMYSIIDGSEDKYAIQSRNTSDLSLEERIPLGLSTQINEATIYSIAVDRFEGTFMENNTIYLKDSFVNITHNLSESDYNFTSETGEFNDRFEIVFTLDTLSTDEFALSKNDLIIIDIDQANTKFKINGNRQIQSVKLIDLLGRTLYYFDSVNAPERIFNLSNLSQTTYIAQVTLANGKVITKKAVKRK